MSVIKNTNSPWLAALMVGLLFLLVMIAQLNAHDGDPSYFISIGEWYVVRPEALPPNVAVLPDSPGYDGQFYYQLALNPFNPQEVNGGLNINNGPYRHQRIVYPLVVWLFSLGNPRLVPAMLLLVNFLALCTIAWLGGRYAQINNKHALWGCLFALYPGFLFTLTRDLTEILAVMFLLAFIFTFQKSPSMWLPVLFLTLAVFTRETTLLVVIAMGVAIFLGRHYARWPLFIVPLLLFGIWQLLLWAKWGQLPTLAGSQNIGLPGSGFLLFINAIDPNNFMHRTWLVELGMVGIVAVTAFLAALRSSENRVPEKLSWLAYGLFFLSLTPHVWVEDLAFMRAISEFFLFSLVLIFTGAHKVWLPLLALIIVATWIVVFWLRLNW